VALGIISEPTVAGMKIAKIHIAGAGPIVLAIVYAYYLNYMNRLFESLAALPAVFPDGSEVYRHPDPWFLANFVRLHTYQPRREVIDLGPWGPEEAKSVRDSIPSTAYIAAFLIWWPVPLALAGALVGFIYLDHSNIDQANPDPDTFFLIIGLNIVTFLFVTWLSMFSHHNAVQALRTVNGQGLEEAQPFNYLRADLTVVLLFLAVCLVLMFMAQGY
jgi:hypothetical protein